MDDNESKNAVDIDRTNPAETVRELMENLGDIEMIGSPEPAAVGVARPDLPVLISVPRGRAVFDVRQYLKARVRPSRRKGKMEAHSLTALIDWTKRFKGESSMLFLDRREGFLSLTAVANYFGAGGPMVDLEEGDELADWCDHRAVYQFPLSREWNRWTSANGKAMDVPEFGEFLDDNAKDLLDPTAPLSGVGDPETNWERHAIEIADRLGGRFADVAQMLSMGRDFRVFSNERAHVTVDRSSGQAQIAFKEEHTDETGAPLKLPNLFLIKIPVFDSGAVYPLVVRFMYRRQGPKLFFDIYDPARARDDAITEAAEKAEFETGLQLLNGLPEN